LISVFLKEFIVIHIVKKCSACTEPEGSSLGSKKAVFRACFEPVQSLKTVFPKSILIPDVC
jgi:hypothetical protein